MKPQIQKFVDYRYAKEFKKMGSEARKTLHNIADKAVASIPKGEIVWSSDLHDVFMLSFVKRKPVTSGMFTALPQDYFASIRRRCV